MKKPSKYNIVLNDEEVSAEEVNKVADMNLRMGDGIIICLLCDKF